MGVFGFLVTVVVVGGVVTTLPFILGYSLITTGMREVSYSVAKGLD